MNENKYLKKRTVLDSIVTVLENLFCFLSLDLFCEPIAGIVKKGEIHSWISPECHD